MIRQSGNDHLTLLEKVLADTKPTRTNFLLARAFLLKHYGVARKQTIDSLARILDYLPIAPLSMERHDRQCEAYRQYLKDKG